MRKVRISLSEFIGEVFFLLGVIGFITMWVARGIGIEPENNALGVYDRVELWIMVGLMLISGAIICGCQVIAMAIREQNVDFPAENPYD